MPWRESTMSKERMQFVAAFKAGEGSMSELCRAFGIQRKTGYKWVKRFEDEGPGGLEERSRKPLRSGTAVPDDVVSVIIDARRTHPRWGPKKLRVLLAEQLPGARLPSRSTIASILKRHGLAAPLRRRKRVPRFNDPFELVNGPNSVWSIDFKGDFRLGDGTQCYTLTVTDNFSRMILRCQVVESTSTQAVKPVMESAFREFGVPRAIRMDNGPPFAARGAAGLTELTVWFIRLGIIPERIKPGRPDQNGRHERMHRTLKEATASPPAECISAQQRRYAAFVHEFNHERPHEAIGMRRPAQVYRRSPRELPDVLPEVTYDRDLLTSKVSKGTAYFRNTKVFVSLALHEQNVAAELHEPGVLLVWFSFLPLGLLVIDPERGGGQRRAVKLQPVPEGVAMRLPGRRPMDPTGDVDGESPPLRKWSRARAAHNALDRLRLPTGPTGPTTEIP
jgi:putative transposase